MLANIKNNDLVLEVGSGDFPNPFSDVLVDKFPLDNSCRRRNIHIDNRLFICADAQKLPFRDKSFNYIIASKVLPYIDDPDSFFKELMRLAPRGTITAWSELFESLIDTELHKWHVNLVNGKLVLKRKTGGAREFGRLFYLLREKDRYFIEFFNQHWPLFELAYNWQGYIDYQMVQPSTKVIDFEDIEAVERFISKRKSRLIRFLNLFLTPQSKNFIKTNFIKIRKKRRKIKLTDILVCPACRNDVAINEGSVECKGCGRAYPIKNGIPYMLL